MIQQFYFWIFTQKNWKQTLEEIFVHPVHSSIIHNSWNMGATQVPTNGRMNKHNVAYTYNRIVFSLKKKEILILATTWMNVENIRLNELSHS